MGFDGAEQAAVVWLTAPLAANPAITGTKAANLARAVAAGLPVLPGFVLIPAHLAPTAPTGEAAVRAAWHALAAHGGPLPPLAVRSSSAHEDTQDSSMAGRYESVLDVRDWDEFTVAVRTVLASAHQVVPLRPADSTGDTAGMAVLVQPMLTSIVGGVMFGADPVEGRTDRILVSVVDGGPHLLVDGSTPGISCQLTRHGRRVGTKPGEPHARRLLTRGRRTRLAALARRTARLFGSPQDMEFGFDTEDHLWLFQARPITAMADRPPRGARLLGPGPVAETLPGTLQPLEECLWASPMSHGLTAALDITGSAPRRQLRHLPLITTVDGRAAADLRLLGAAAPAHPFLNRLNPAPGARRAAAAWRVGRLRAALPLLALDLIADVDRELAALPNPQGLPGGRLLDAAAWGRAVLSPLHAQEALAGALLPHESATAAGEALAVLAEGRNHGLNDHDLLANHPVLLTLMPPALAASTTLPASVPLTGLPRGTGALPTREALRLRIRWVQEMQTRMIRELANRPAFIAQGADLIRVTLLSWDELVHAVHTGAFPGDLDDRLPRADTGSLPAAFRLAAGRPVAESRHSGADSNTGQGAGGGFGTGTAWDGHGDRPDDAVLVVRTLDPALAPHLPGLAGLVAETGSALSHLAVLAREYSIPTAVGVPAALDRFPSGTHLTVDGTTGNVTSPDNPHTIPQPHPISTTRIEAAA
ncbi:PEP/pyruvate-binding domain-containing protein [Streptomyces cadmiisoli]|uniref:PEP/pyruvate-binding domain-containing protein n=1 Tax=Streptomyces cadmiisoli TaxID=2184053 RepID=UPI003D71D5BC